MTRQFRYLVGIAWLFLLVVGLHADVGLSPVFGDNMVLQAGSPVAVWGKGDAGSTVAVVFDGCKRTAVVAPDGQWLVRLDAMPPSAEGLDLSIFCPPDVRCLTFTNVVVGEVWLCAGQSNMRWPLKECTGAAEAVASDLRGLRLLDFQGRIYPDRREYARETLRRTTAENYYRTEGWRTCTPDTSATFSAVAFYFGLKLHAELGAPVGLILNAIGGVPMEAYMPREVMAHDPTLEELLSEWYRNPLFPQWCRERAALNLSTWLADPVSPMPSHPFEPGFLFDAGMRPLTRFALRGFLWYQGESNATVDGAGGPAVDAAVNRHKFITLIHSWRDAWGNRQLPFYYVQLPGLNRDWELFREMQDDVDREVPHTGMAVTIDVGHPTHVHPRNKKPVGERLALLALRDTYGRLVVAEGPRYRDYRLEHDRIVVEFDHTESGLRAADGQPLRGFSLAGEDREFAAADAVVVGNTVSVTRRDVSMPVAVRYAWADDPKGNLSNGTGLPAAPFRTDGWPLTSP